MDVSYVAEDRITQTLEYVVFILCVNQVFVLSRIRYILPEATLNINNALYVLRIMFRIFLEAATHLVLDMCSGNRILKYQI